MIHLLKFILIFNRRVFIVFNLALYALLLFFFHIVQTANVINFFLYVAFIAVILLMKAVYEFTIYRREIGVLKTLGAGTPHILLFRVVEKVLFVAVAWALLKMAVLFFPVFQINVLLVSEAFTICLVEAAITLTYFLFAILQDITRLMKEE